MNCSEVQELLSAYFDGELGSDQRSHLAEHLKQCPDCSNELAGFEALSTMASDLTVPMPPAGIWEDIEQQLDQSTSSQQQPGAQSAADRPSRSLVAPSRLLALAATIIVAAGFSWVMFQSWFAHGEHDQFTAEFGEYLDEFQRDPETAQDILLAKYENQLIDPDKANERVGYRPAVAGGLPPGYSLVSTHVMKMPCCTCVMSVCRRTDGSTLAFFEHDDEETTEWFGDRPEIKANCGNKQCSLVQLDSHIAASWKRGTRHITLVGVRDTNEISNMVAWLESRTAA